MLIDENTPDLDQDDNEVQEVEENEAAEVAEVDATDWKAEALKYKAILDRNKNKKREPAKQSNSKQNSNEFGYGEKAFLNANGIKGSKEIEFVQNELKQSGSELDSLLENDYFTARLEKFRALNATAEATPTGNRSGSQPLDSVEYWMSKPIKDVPQEMRIKVVNAKLAKEKTKGVFYNS